MTPWLRRLGCRGEDLRRGVAACASIPDEPLEQRVRVALKSLMPPHRHVAASVAMAT